MAENNQTALVSEPHSVTQDVDAAHARLRSHQANLDYINSRMEGADRRIDRLERRLDDQSATLATVSAVADSIQREVHTQTAAVNHVSDRTRSILDRLDEHIKIELEQETTRTEQLERLHRTMIRVASILALIAIIVLPFLSELGLFELATKLAGVG